MENKEVYLHFMYSDNCENPKRFIVDELSFDGGNTTKSRPFNMPEPPHGKIRILKCPCGGNSGRRMAAICMNMNVIAADSL